MHITQKRFTSLLYAIMALGLVLRLGLVGWLYRMPIENPSDSQDYVRVSHLMQRGQVDFGRPPAYPFFLGLVQRGQAAVGAEGLPIKLTAGIVQSLLGAVSIWLLAKLIERRLTTNSRQIALITAALYAVLPGVTLWATSLMTEALALPLFVTACAALLWREQPSFRLLIVGGVLFALGVLTRSATLPVLLAAVVTLKMGAPWKVWLGRATALLLGPILVLGLWTGFAYQQSGHLFFVDTTSAQNLCLASSENATGIWNDSCSPPEKVDTREDQSQLLHDSAKWAIANPGRWIQLRYISLSTTMVADGSVFGLLPFDNPYTIVGVVTLIILPSAIAWYFLLYGASVGSWKNRRQNFVQQLGIISMASLVCPYYTFGDQRFHLLVFPFLCMTTAFWLTSSTRWPGSVTARALRRLNPPDRSP